MCDTGSCDFRQVEERLGRPERPHATIDIHGRTGTHFRGVQCGCIHVSIVFGFHIFATRVRSFLTEM